MTTPTRSKRNKTGLWRFNVGQQVYLRPTHHPTAARDTTQLHEFSEAFVVTGTFVNRGWPHYKLMDPQGKDWSASQLELSSVPFPALAL
jgi:hypothetical protein